MCIRDSLEGRMKANKELRYHVTAYANAKSVAQQLKTAKRPAVFEEQHRAELTAYREMCIRDRYCARCWNAPAKFYTTISRCGCSGR